MPARTSRNDQRARRSRAHVAGRKTALETGIGAGSPILSQPDRLLQRVIDSTGDSQPRMLHTCEVLDMMANAAPIAWAFAPSGNTSSRKLNGIVRGGQSQPHAYRLSGFTAIALPQGIINPSNAFFINAHSGRGEHKVTISNEDFTIRLYGCLHAKQIG